MACTDDDFDEERTPRLDSFHYDPTVPPPMAADTEESKTHTRLSNGRWQIEQHYIPFPRTEWHPIGCTSSHVFAVIKNDRHEYSPIAMQLTYRNMRRPSQCIGSEFVSPWKKYPEPFFHFLGGCAYNDRMCLVMQNSLIIINATWKVHMRDNCVAFRTLISCSMNSRYLVVVGVETGKTEQSMFIYDLTLSLPRRIYYKDVIDENVLAVHLLSNITEAMLVQCESGRTRRMVIEARDGLPRYCVKDFGDLCTTGGRERPTLAKELADTSHIVQLIDKSFVLIKSRTDVDRTKLEQQLVIDVVDYEHGVVVSHDSDNSLHFYTSRLSHIVTVPWESMAAASLYYENGIPSILRPYPSLGKCVDAPNIVVLLASFGALVTVKML